MDDKSRKLLFNTAHKTHNYVLMAKHIHGMAYKSIVFKLISQIGLNWTFFLLNSFDCRNFCLYPL